MGDFFLRAARPADANWVLSQVSRLHEFGPPPHRSTQQMDAGEAVAIQDGLATLGADDRVFLIAEHNADHTRLGFVYALTLRDFFTGEPHAHIADLVVSREGEGQGVGSALMHAAEAWASARGYRFATLGVFPANQRALRLYQRLGYEPDVLRMFKLLPPPDEAPPTR